VFDQVHRRLRDDLIATPGAGAIGADRAAELPGAGVASRFFASFTS
jgi:hypothetical protein